MRPSQSDPTIHFTAGLDDVVMTSHGSKLLGGFYRGAGAGPRPTAILLHGVPGVEKNLDIAYALRDAGWNCLYFHYRGSWGSEGSYSFAGALDDTLSAADWVSGHKAVDRERLAIVGNSFGGYIALAATGKDSRFKATVSITPLIDPATAVFREEMFDEFAAMLHGLDGMELKAQWEALPAIRAGGLRFRKILLVTADEDEVFAPNHYEALLADLNSLEHVQVPQEDHVFSTGRTQLVELTVKWLESAIES